MCLCVCVVVSVVHGDHVCTVCSGVCWELECVTGGDVT